MNREFDRRQHFAVSFVRLSYEFELDIVIQRELTAFSRPRLGVTLFVCDQFSSTCERTFAITNTRRNQAEH